MNAIRKNNNAGMSQVAEKLNDFIKDVYLEQLYEAVNDVLEEKRSCLQANSPYFKLPFGGRVYFGNVARKVHQKRALMAHNPAPFSLSDAPENSPLTKTLKQMAFDDDFAGLVDAFDRFSQRIKGLAAPEDIERWAINVTALTYAFPESSFVGQRFAAVRQLLLGEKDKFKEDFAQVQKLIDDSDVKIERVANALNMTPSKVKPDSLEQHVAAQLPGYHAQHRGSPIVKRKYIDKDSQEKECLSFEPNVLGNYKNEISAIVNYREFNDKLARGYEGGFFKSLFRGAKQLLGGSMQSRVSSLTQQVLDVLESPDMLDVSAALQQFRRHWLAQGGLSPDQFALLRKLSIYEALLRSKHIAVGAPGINAVATQLIDEAERAYDHVEKVRDHLGSAYDVPVRGLFRSKSFSQVVTECKESNKRNIVPDANVLDSKDYAYIGKLVLLVANHTHSGVEHGLTLDSCGNLVSDDSKHNDFLRKINSSDLCFSRRYIFLLLSLVVRVVDKDKAIEIKSFLSRVRAQRDLLGQLRGCKSFPDIFKSYFPHWQGVFLPEASVMSAIHDLESIEPVGDSARLSNSFAVDLDTSADLNKPKTAEEIDAFSYDQLQFYAQSVCHLVITKGMFSTPKKNIHPLIEKYFKTNNNALRPGHQPLKFLWAMLEWYRDCKLATLSNLNKVGADFKKTESFIFAVDKVIQRIENYLRGDLPASHLGMSNICLGALLEIDFKRKPDGSFNKLLTFVALKYTDERGKALLHCDLTKKFRDDVSRRAQERAAAKAAKKAAKQERVDKWMTYFGAKKVAQAVSRHSSFSGRTSSIGSDYDVVLANDADASSGCARRLFDSR